MTSSQDTGGEAAAGAPPRACSAAEIGAIAHLYRGEIYRSTVWRTRLDSTTNWAVVTTGIALSATFSSAQASPLPMALVGLIVTMFLLLHAPPPPLFQHRARPRAPARDRLLHAHAARRPGGDERRLEPAARPRPVPAALPREPRARRGPAPAAHLCLDLPSPD